MVAQYPHNGCTVPPQWLHNTPKMVAQYLHNGCTIPPQRLGNTFESDSTVSEFQRGKAVRQGGEDLAERLHALVVKAIVGEIKMCKTGLGVGLHSSEQPGCSISVKGAGH